MSQDSTVYDSLQAELAYLYEEKSLLDQLIRELELFARLTGQMSSGPKQSERRTRSSQHG